MLVEREEEEVRRPPSSTYARVEILHNVNFLMVRRGVL